MNIVIEIAPPLIAAVDGRRRLELGVPPNSDVADIVDTLLKLYPKLVNHVTTDRLRKSQTGMNVYWSGKNKGEMPVKSRLLEGQTVYLCASPSKRLAES
jgi:hypothetical protein